MSAESAGLIVVFVDVMNVGEENSIDSSISASDADEDASRVKFLATGPSVMLVVALVSFVMLVLFRVMISADMSDSVEVWFVFDKVLSADTSADRVTDFASDKSADVAMDAFSVVADVAVDVDDANDVVVVGLVVAGLVVFAIALPVNLLSIGS